MVSKQQQLEWLAKNISKFPDGMHKVFASVYCVGIFVGFLAEEKHEITLQEWQRERDKILKQPTQPAIDSSWYECGELPPVGVTVELWFGGSLAYNCEFIAIRGNAYVVWNLDDDKPDCADSMNSQFRPLRTEREKAIEEMTGIISSSVFGTAKQQAEHLYEAGYRKVKS